jgi:hypothetical protein
VIPLGRTTVFTPTLFKEKVRTAINECLESGITIRLVFRRCVPEIVDNKVKQMGLSHRAHVWYDLDDVIVKLMPSKRHGYAAAEFIKFIYYRVALLPGHGEDSIHLIGSSRFKSGSRSKESDGTIRCATRQGGDWPNIVVEIGVSERLINVQRDCQWWLVASNGRVKMAIAIHVGRTPDSIHIET